MALVSCVADAGGSGRPTPYLFRTYSAARRVRSVFPGTARARVWHAVRASAAAPAYFAEFRLDGRGPLHQDGGILVNNPAAVGLHEAKTLWGPAAMHQGILVSVGTGRALAPPNPPVEQSGSGWKDKFNRILDSATDTEGVHQILNDLLPAGGYFRLNPPLLGPCAMDETSPHELKQLRAATDAYIRRNADKLQRAADALTAPRTISSIHSRTAYVISALVSAREAGSVAARAEAFIQHLHQYPEARDLAIKEGAIRALLRVQSRLKDDSPETKEVQGIINEALALSGYTPPPGGRGPRILSLDGGGIRGLVAIQLLQDLEARAGRRVHELFDYIIGVSTGAIIAAVIGSGVGTLDTASEMYHTLSKEMFGNTSVIGGTSRLVWQHAYYDTERWERMLRDNLRDITLGHCNRHHAPKMALVSCVADAGGSGRPTPYLFRTYSAARRVRSVFPGTARARVWHAVRASAAAPAYFAEFRLDGRGPLHQDGGILVNNPAAVGLHEAKTLWGPAAMHRGILVSVGTGRALAPPNPPVEQSGSGWKDKFNRILDSATDTEGVHQILNDLLPAGGYFRLNPPLLGPCAMDETSPHELKQLRAATDAYIRRNADKLQRAADALTAPRTIVQKTMDYIHHKALIMGVNTY